MMFERIGMFQQHAFDIIIHINHVEVDDAWDS